MLAAVKAIFGGRAIVQRCRVHKQRNILDYLPKEKQEQARWRLRAAWQKTSYTEAKKELRAVAKWLDTISPQASNSLAEALEETLTLHRLKLPDQLSRSLSSTNLIESCFSRTESWTRRVKRWRGAHIVMRWGAAALLVAEQGFRRIRGYRHLPARNQERSLTNP